MQRLAAVVAATLLSGVDATTLMIGAPNFYAYPGYAGGFQSVSGTVQIRAAAKDSTSQTLEWSLEGIDPACTSGAGDGFGNGCGIHVHSGTSCAEASLVGGHWYAGGTDPWADVVYVASGTTSSGSSTVTTGLTLSEMEGRAFVVHLLTGGRIACGILSSSSLTIGVSTLSTYPGYTGSLSATGTVQIRAATDDSALQTLDWNLEGIDSACTSGAGDGFANGCGIHVHSGTSCAEASLVGGHYYTTGTDPWADIVYVASGTTSSGSTTVTTGLKLSELVGRAFVVHQLTGGRIACGILQSGTTKISVSSGISQYPGYTGSLSVTGVVSLTGDTTQTLTWDLAGLDTACASGAGDAHANGCGIHVHAGTSCEDASWVGGHYYSSGLGADPWSDVVYVADSSGSSSSSATVSTGFTLWELAGRAFVIHALAGGRIACGTLVAGETATVASFSSYPGYTGSLGEATGTVSITSSGLHSQVLTWDLTGLDPGCPAGAGGAFANGCGIHVHSGTTCADASMVGGHYYTGATDPWADIVFVSDSSGASTGTVSVTTGLTLPDLVGKAFVVHDSTGARVGCGLVSATAPGLYAYGELGETVCPDGYVAITEATACEAASAYMGVTYMPEQNDNGEGAVCNGQKCAGPRGCKKTVFGSSEIRNNGKVICEVGPTPAPLYAYGELGETVCPDGYIEITEATACEVASAYMEVTYTPEQNDNGAGAICNGQKCAGPRGCKKTLLGSSKIRKNGKVLCAFGGRRLGEAVGLAVGGEVQINQDNEAPNELISTIVV